MSDSWAIFFIKRMGFFDKKYYRESVIDLEGMTPLRHYVSRGDQLGLKPFILFEPNFYRKQVKGRLKNINSLIHYYYIGQYNRLNPSPWFDTRFYLKNNPDVKKAGVNPLKHYLAAGGLEGRAPCPDFDSFYYLTLYPDTVQQGLNPLVHYLLEGRKQGRLISSVLTASNQSSPSVADVPIAPSDREWLTLISQRNKNDTICKPNLDIIIPVYKGYAETARCIYSVLTSSNQVEYELIVINDGSPDQSITDALRFWAESGLFTLLENNENMGFVKTVNRGMSLHIERDVVLLNADAEVYNDWLDRLGNLANNNSKIATITPLSNNATICSYPQFLQDNPSQLEIDYSTLDHLASQINSALDCHTPTGVGFCMYIRRACLAQIGLFDEGAFGKGYGEENDFCQRAVLAGWKNIIAPSIFVKHWGSASFQGERLQRVENALKILNRRYPSYQKQVSQFIQSDPLAKARYNLDYARLLKNKNKENVLMICHQRGGGTEQHLREDTRFFESKGYGVFYLRPHLRLPGQVYLQTPKVDQFLNLSLLALEDTNTFLKLIKDLNISQIHIHSLIDFGAEAVELMQKLILEVKKLTDNMYSELNIHDYAVICPRINLIDKNSIYCGEPDENTCNECLRKNGSTFGVTSIQDWRKNYAGLLSIVDSVSVPDEDVSYRLSRYFPKFKYDINPHDHTDSILPPPSKSVIPTNRPITIVVIGAVSRLKGYDVLLKTAKYSLKHKLPIRFIVMGYSSNDQLLEKAGVEVTGKYAEENAIATLKQLNADIVWLPSTWPETFSYTLSLAFEVEKPIMAFDIGAIGRRLRARGQVTYLHDISLIGNFEKLFYSMLHQ